MQSCLSHPNAKSSSKKFGTESVSMVNGSNDRKNLPIIKKLTPEEIMERISRGLCFNCNKQFTLGRRCKRLFYIEAIWKEEQNSPTRDSDEDTSNEEEEREVDLLKLSLQAFTREVTPKTIKLHGVLKK